MRARPGISGLEPRSDRTDLSAGADAEKKHLVEAIVKHEVAHHFDEVDGTKSWYEVGRAFEDEVYGGIITDNISHAAGYEQRQRGQSGPASGISFHIAPELQAYADASYEEYKYLQVTKKPGMQ